MKRLTVVLFFAALAALCQDKKGGASYVNTFGKGAAAVSRTVEDKLREAVSIRDYGAKCDGATDDITAIQAAIDAMSAAGGGTVEVPNGCTAIITAHPVIPSNVTLAGKNESSVIKVGDNAWPVSKAVTDATNTTPIVITSAAHGFSTGYYVGVQNVGGNTAANGAWYVTWLSADTFSLDDSEGNGAYTSGGDATRITDAWMTTGGYAHLGAIATEPNAAKVTIRDLTLDLNGANQTNPLYGGDGISFVATTDSTIDHVRIIGMRMPGRMIALLSNTGGNNRVLGSTAVGYGGPGGTCAGGIFVQIPRFVVDGNRVSKVCDEAFIPHSPGATGGIWTNNTFLGDNIIDGPAAFHVEDSSRQVFIGNFCRGWTAACFNIAPTGEFGSSSTDIAFIGNTVEPDGANKPYLGIGCTGDGFGHTATGVSIIGNVISGGSGNGIGVGAGCNKVSGHGNTIRDNAALGFYTDNSNDRLDFTYNTLTGNAGGGGAAQITTQTGPLSPNDTIITSPNVTDDNTNGLALSIKHGWDTVPSATAITPTGQIFHVSGTAAISTINLWQSNIQTGTILHMIADGAFTLTTGGNIGAAAAAQAGEVLTVVWDGNLWWPGTNYSGTVTLTTEQTISGQKTFSAAQTLFDSGASPSASQLRIMANALGGVSILSYAADNSSLNFDSDFTASGWIARDTTAFQIYKSGGKLSFYADSGLTPGNSFTPTLRWAMENSGDLVFNNDIQVGWKDSVGTTIPTLWLDGANNFHIGAQTAPTSAGDMVFYARGSSAFMLTYPGSFILEPITDQTLFLGTDAKRLGGIETIGATIYSVSGGPAYLALQAANYASNFWVNLKAATTGTETYNLYFPPAGPGAANKMLLTGAAPNYELTWSDIAGHEHAATDITSGTMDTARLGSGTADDTTFLRGDSTWQVPPGPANMMTLDTAQDVTATKTFQADQTLSFQGTNQPSYSLKLQGKDSGGTIREALIYATPDGHIDLHPGALTAGKVRLLDEAGNPNLEALSTGVNFWTHALPGATATYTLGTADLEWSALYVGGIVFTGTMIAPSGTGTDATLDCGTARLKSITVSKGIVLAVACGT